MKHATAFSFIILFFIGLALPLEAIAAAKCAKLLDGKNGCYDSAGTCKVEWKFCRTNKLCGNNGGEMDGGVCVQLGTASGKGANANSASADCANKKGTYGPIDDGVGCYCFTDDNGTLKRPNDFPGGTCGAKSKSVVADVVASGDPMSECTKVNGSYLSIDRDENSACFCFGDTGASRRIDPLKGESCTRSTAGGTQLDQCIDSWSKKAQDCVASAKKAELSCDQKDTEDKGMKYVEDFTKNYANKNIADGAGKGASGQCAQASLIGTTALSGMNAFKENCDTEYSKCEDSCNEVLKGTSKSAILKECRQYATKPQDNTKLEAAIEQIKSSSDDGVQSCVVYAKKKRSLLDETMQSIGKSVQAAKTCECQLAGAGADCQLIPNPINCAPGGPLFGQQICNIYASHDCSLGSQQYSSIPCQCARDSSASVCKTPAGKPVPSNFAVDLKPGTNGGIEVGGPGGAGDDGGNMNLGGNYNVNKPGFEYKDPAETAKGGKPGGGGGGNAGGGGGARGGGGGDDPNALAAGEDDGSTKGLAGLFNQAKSSLSNMLGGGNKVTGKGLSPNGGGQGLRYDINKWRPRGLASAGCQSHQVRCKNEDIFSIVNRRYDVNEPTFLYGP